MALNDFGRSAVAVVRAGARMGGRVVTQAAQPGPEIPVQRFRPGEYSPGAAILAGATAFLAGARSTANYRARLEASRVQQDYVRAQTEHMNAETTKLGNSANTYSVTVPGDPVAGPSEGANPGRDLTTPGTTFSGLTANEALGRTLEMKTRMSTRAATVKALDVGDLEKFKLPGHFLGKSIDDPEVQSAIAGVTPQPAPGAFQQMMSGVDIKGIAKDIKEGRVSPMMMNSASLRGIGPALATELHRNGVDSARLITEWGAMQALTRNVNIGQMANLQRAGSAVDSAVGNMEQLNRDMSAGVARGLWPALNKFSLQVARSGAYGADAQQIARRYDGQLAVLRTEVPLVLSGGYAPQAPQIKDAHDMLLNSDSEGGLAATLDVLKQNVGYKVLSIKSLGLTVPGGGESGMYQWVGGAQAPTGGAQELFYDQNGNLVDQNGNPAQ